VEAVIVAIVRAIVRAIVAHRRLALASQNRWRSANRKQDGIEAVLVMAVTVHDPKMPVTDQTVADNQGIPPETEVIHVREERTSVDVGMTPLKDAAAPLSVDLTENIDAAVLDSAIQTPNNSYSPDGIPSGSAISYGFCR